MKNVLSSNRAVGAIALSLVVLSILLFYSSGERGATVGAESYHLSKWNEFAPEIERAINEGTFMALSLNNVKGGIAPHHIPLTIPDLVKFYARIKASQEVDSFIIIGPDHNDASKSKIAVSNMRFNTAFGDTSPMKGFVQRIEDSKIALVDEPPFEEEHSVGAHILVISRVFPNATIAPVIVRSDVDRESALALGKFIGKQMGERTMVIASVDFSHYLTSEQAMPVDRQSAEILRRLDLSSIPFVEADSIGALTAFASAMLEIGAVDSDSIEVLNTNDLMQNFDYTTGYIFGYWGIK